jgi:hypothetical protein
LFGRTGFANFSRKLAKFDGGKAGGSDHAGGSFENWRADPLHSTR